MNFVIACLRPSQNVKLGIFTGSVQLTAKKCTKKRDARAKLLFCLVQLLFIWLSRRRHFSNLLFTTHCDPSKTEYSRGKFNCSRWQDPKRFFDSSSSSFPVRKVENKSFPCTHKLGERTGQLWRDNSRRVRAHEKNSGDAVRRLGTIIQRIFCAQSGTSILLTVWKWSGESPPRGSSVHA